MFKICNKSVCIMYHCINLIKLPLISSSKSGKWFDCWKNEDALPPTGDGKSLSRKISRGVRCPITGLLYSEIGLLHSDLCCLQDGKRTPGCAPMFLPTGGPPPSKT